MAEQSQVEKLIRIYREYQDNLLQVTRKNRSILLKKIYNKHNFDLVDIEESREGTIKKIINNAIKSSESSINVLSERETDQKSDFARAKLKTLERNLRQIEDETGEQIGYVGFPFLVGHPNDDFYIRGPIVLFPITLEHRRLARNGGWFVKTTEKKPILNGALISALKKKGEFSLPENYEETFDNLMEEIAQAESEDMDYLFFTKINSWIKNLIPIDDLKNQSSTVKLDDINQDDIQALGKQPFHLINYKIIGNFPQADNEIFKDYTELMKRSTLDAQIVNELLEIKSPSISQFESDTANSSDDSKNIQLNLVVPSDSSQDDVIIQSKKNNILVVSGPPGTGKSQVIVNLISDALTNGQKVLVVCQKRAALEVVHDRLSEVGLDRYIVFLDKENDDRLKMYKKLNGIIEQECIVRPASDLDIDYISMQIDRKTKFLSDLGMALSKEYFGGASAHKLYSIAYPGFVPALNLHLCEPETDFRNLADYLINIQSVEIYFKKYEDEKFPWYGRKPFFLLGTIEKSRIEEDIVKIISLLADSIISPTFVQQKNLVSLFDTYQNNPGFLKMNRKNASKKIKQILNVEVSDQYIAENLDKVNQGLEFWNKLLGLTSFFSEKRSSEITSMIKDKKQFKIFLESTRESLREFDLISYYDKKKQELAPNIFKILSQCKSKFSLDENWNEIIKQEIYAFWIDKIEKDNQILIGDPFTNYELNRKELAQLLEKKEHVVLNKIQHTIDNLVNPSLLYQKRKTADQEKWAEFNKELKRKRKVMPVRKLFEIYRNQLLEIAPCWLSSPESVSKVFPLQKGLFDLVIVDEASQLAAERAIPFLHRAGRTVIAGDRQQLQPFDLFQIKEDESDDFGKEAPPEKSLLDLALVQSRKLGLRWHYRSKYQDLINFSNYAFYDGELNVVPNARIDPSEPPIRWIECKGIWEDSLNRMEAQQVISEIKNTWKEKFSKTGRYPSIGVIALNEGQQNLIEDLLDKQLESDPEFSQLWDEAHQGKKKNDKLFVKNIENVQGDERDIIIFSITLAKDPGGSFSNTRLSTMTHKGGENRLNVAITRAREEMVIVCSIDPTEIKETSENRGPKLLRKFLEYAKATNMLNKEAQSEILSNLDSAMQRRSIRKITFDSDFEMQVHNRLEQLGYTVETQVGESDYRIDLAIVHPTDKNQYVLAIECDGATFHSAKNVKERDILRQKFLESKGWNIERIWSRNWWKSPQKEIDRISSKINEIIKKESITKTTYAPKPSFEKTSMERPTSQPKEETPKIVSPKVSIEKEIESSEEKPERITTLFDKILDSISTPNNFESYLELLVLKLLLENENMKLNELDEYMQEICNHDSDKPIIHNTLQILDNLQNKNKIKIQEKRDTTSVIIRLETNLTEFEKSLLEDRIGKKISAYLNPSPHEDELIEEDKDQNMGNDEISIPTNQSDEENLKQLDIIQKILDANPIDSKNLYEKARFLLLLGRTDEAVKTLDKAITINPSLNERLKRDVDFEKLKSTSAFDKMKRY